MVTIVDTVTLDGLCVGENYTLSGILMDRATGKALSIGEVKSVVAEFDFTAASSSMQIPVTFTFDAGALNGATTVVFETLYHGNTEIASHKDLQDENQTVYLPSVKTTAKDKESNSHYAAPVKNTTIVDTVAYTNLIPGKTYTLTGKLMDKATGTPVLKDGLYQLASYGQINLVKAVQEMGLSTPDGWFNVNYKFLGLDLTATPWEYVKSFTFTWAVIGVILIPILAGLSQFVFSKLTMKTQPQADAAGGASMKSMMYMMPLFSVYIAFVMPAALGVYWIAQSVFSLIQEAILNKTLSAKMEAEEEARFQARQADRQKRMEEARIQERQRQQEEQKKQTLREKQQAAQAAKAVKAAKAATSTTEAGRVGDRPYARGRAYKADRYDET